MNFEQARHNMIEQQIRPWNVLDATVLDVLSSVRREDFVPAAQRALAFADLELPLRSGGEQGQCMLTPKVEARMLQELALRKHETVLEIGTGSGYMAALLAQCAQQVLSLELEPELVTLARANLQQASANNAQLHKVQVRRADGAQGAPQDGPFDAIVLSGSVAQVPHSLLEQLKQGGRLLAIVGAAPVMRATLVTRSSAHEFTSRQTWDTLAPRLRNFPEPARFRF